METLKEVFQSLIDGYKERTKSPLIGSFMISFFFFNWKFFAILFYSNWTMPCRIKWIEEHYNFYYNFGIPLLIALFYVLVLPYINLGFEYCLNKYTNSKTQKNNRIKIDKLKQKALEAIEQRNIADAKAGTSEINNLNDRNKALNREIETLIDQLKVDSNRHQEVINQYKDREDKSSIDFHNLNSEILVLRKELENAKDDLKYRKLKIKYKDESDIVIQADKNLSISEKTYFYQHFTKVNKGIKSEMADSMAKKYFRYELMGMGHSHDKEYMLSNYGDAFYYFLQSNNYDLM